MTISFILINYDCNFNMIYLFITLKRGKHQKQVEYARKVQNQNSKQLIIAKNKPSDVTDSNIAEDGTPIDPAQPTKRQMVLV